MKLDLLLGWTDERFWLIDGLNDQICVSIEFKRSRLSYMVFIFYRYCVYISVI